MFKKVTFSLIGIAYATGNPMQQNLVEMKSIESVLQNLAIDQKSLMNLEGAMDGNSVLDGLKQINEALTWAKELNIDVGGDGLK